MFHRFYTSTLQHSRFGFGFVSQASTKNIRTDRPGSITGITARSYEYKIGRVFCFLVPLRYNLAQLLQRDRVSTLHSHGPFDTQPSSIFLYVYSYTPTFQGTWLDSLNFRVLSRTRRPDALSRSRARYGLLRAWRLFDETKRHARCRPIASYAPLNCAPTARVLQCSCLFEIMGVHISGKDRADKESQSVSQSSNRYELVGAAPIFTRCGRAALTPGLDKKGPPQNVNPERSGNLNSDPLTVKSGLAFSQW